MSSKFPLVKQNQKKERAVIMVEYIVEFSRSYDHPSLPAKIIRRVEAENYYEAETKALKKLREKVGNAGESFYSIYDVR